MLKMFELFLIAVLIVVVVTQVIVPAYQRRKLFPFFRRQHKLESKVIELNQYKIEKSIENEIKNERKKNVQ